MQSMKNVENDLCRQPVLAMKVSETVLSRGEGGYISAEFDGWGKDNATERCCGVRRIRGREALAGKLGAYNFVTVTECQGVHV